MESSTLPVEVGITAAATVPFVPSSMTPDFISGSGLRTRHPTERFVISDSSHDLNANGIDDEVTSVIRSSMPPPPILTAAIATTIIAGATSAPVHESGVRQVQPSIFRDSASLSMAEDDVAGPSQPVGIELSAGSFYVSQDMDPETLRQVYIPKWNVINDSVLDDPDVYREAEAAEAIHLSGQIADVEAVEATRVNELKDLKEKEADLEGRDLSNLQLSCDELSVKASSLEFEKEKLVDQVSALETTCSGLYLDAELMRMALHLDEEFYPCYLTTIAGQKWILSRRLRLVVMKCLQSPEYLAALGGAIGFAAYDPATEENYVAAVNALRAVDFPFLAQLASHKDSSMSDLMDLLCLEGPAAEAPEAEQLQPLLDQTYAFPNHRLQISAEFSTLWLLMPGSYSCAAIAGT
ncbi:hypothetical protein Tco_0945167 [Tanacetum coccineum]